MHADIRITKKLYAPDARCLSAKAIDTIDAFLNSDISIPQHWVLGAEQITASRNTITDPVQLSKRPARSRLMSRGGIMLDPQQIANSYALWVSVLIVVHVICAPFIAKAARRKNRSFGSFFILALILGPVITGLEVAKLAFDVEDPKAPQSREAFSLGKFLGL